MRSEEIYGKNLAKAMLLEVPLVLGRTTEGKAFAMRDACPHRGIPLSYGHFDGRICNAAITVGIRSVQRAVRRDSVAYEPRQAEGGRINAAHYPCEERDGYVWVYMSAPGTRLPEKLPNAPELEKFSTKFKITRLECELPSHIDHGLSD